MVGIQEEDKTLRITFLNHFVAFFPLLLWLSLMFFSFYMLIETFFILSIMAVPAFFLHIEYWLYNKGEKYIIREKEILHLTQGNTVVHKNQDIEKITIYVSPIVHKKMYTLFIPTDNYFYAIIRLKTGEELILTSLVSPSLDEKLKRIKGVLFDRRMSLICTPRYRHILHGWF